MSSNLQKLHDEGTFASDGLKGRDADCLPHEPVAPDYAVSAVRTGSLHCSRAKNAAFCARQQEI